MKVLKLPKEKLYSYLETLKKWGELWGPVKKGDKYVYDKLDDVRKVALEALRTILPPKKFFLPLIPILLILLELKENSLLYFFTVLIIEIDLERIMWYREMRALCDRTHLHSAEIVAFLMAKRDNDKDVGVQQKRQIYLRDSICNCYAFSLSRMEDGMIFMALKPPTDEYGFWGDRVMISTGEDRDIENYKELTNERTVSHSFAKRSRYKGNPFVVGAIARMNLLGERLSGISEECFRKCYTLSWIRNPLYNNLAQAIEIVYCLEKIPKIVDEILSIPEIPPIVAPQRQEGTGTGAVEAPRGTLYHHYEIENGRIKHAEIITPTAQNLENMERHIWVGAETLLKESPPKEDMELKLEMIVRAYDPCISCSAHLVKIVEKE